MHSKTIALSLAISLLGAGTAVAHPEHDHHPKPAPAKPAAVDEGTAKARGERELARLVSVKKIHESWKSNGRFNAIKKTSQGDKWEWLVTFDNDKVKENQRLYVFLTQSGEFVAANFTGR